MSSKHAKRNLLLIIDPQVDFHKGGSLPVEGALGDAQRIAKLIRTKRFDNIIVTLDTHQFVDIGHPLWWTNDEKEEPKPFTIITTKDIEKGVWRAAREEDQKWTEDYVKKLEENKRFQHTIWPYHCIIGTPGHSVIQVVNDALAAWSKKNSQMVSYVWKGTNPKAEMYSAFKADVEVPGADETKLNTSLLDHMLRYDHIVVCGQAASHCVMNSVIDMVAYFGSRKQRNLPQIFLLNDCTSPVEGYKAQTMKWFKDINNCKFLQVLPLKKLTAISASRK